MFTCTDQTRDLANVITNSATSSSKPAPRADPEYTSASLRPTSCTQKTQTRRVFGGGGFFEPAEFLGWRKYGVRLGGQAALHTADARPMAWPATPLKAPATTATRCSTMRGLFLRSILKATLVGTPAGMWRGRMAKSGCYGVRGGRPWRKWRLTSPRFVSNKKTKVAIWTCEKL